MNVCIGWESEKLLQYRSKWRWIWVNISELGKKFNTMQILQILSLFLMNYFISSSEIYFLTIYSLSPLY